MAGSFSLSTYPWAYVARHTETGTWREEFQEKPHKTAAEEAALSPEELTSLLASRNSFPDLPLVNYTSQYGLGCFEGLKAFPQKDGSLKIFRPEENAKRMGNSMEGLGMPRFPEDMFLNAVKTIVKRNQALGFAPAYDQAWEKDNFITGHSIYLRPFSWAEPGIGVNLSRNPAVVIVATPVGAYFAPGNSKAVVTDKVRAFPGGTGWIKCNANYTVPTLAKAEAVKNGYMEAIFLDAAEQKYVEEGSSCNIFFLLKNGKLVTPNLQDTILPGINRASVLTLAQDMGVTTEERRIPIDEVLSDAVECFVTGTAAGVSYIESITHKGKTALFNGGKIGELTTELLHTLKGIHYGAVEDKHNWMTPVE